MVETDLVNLGINQDLLGQHIQFLDGAFNCLIVLRRGLDDKSIVDRVGHNAELTSKPRGGSRGRGWRRRLAGGNRCRWWCDCWWRARNRSRSTDRSYRDGSGRRSLFVVQLGEHSLNVRGFRVLWPVHVIAQTRCLNRLIEPIQPTL